MTALHVAQASPICPLPPSFQNRSQGSCWPWVSGTTQNRLLSPSLAVIISLKNAAKGHCFLYNIHTGEALLSALLASNKTAPKSLVGPTMKLVADRAYPTSNTFPILHPGVHFRCDSFSFYLYVLFFFLHPPPPPLRQRVSGHRSAAHSSSQWLSWAAGRMVAHTAAHTELRLLTAAQLPGETLFT